MSEVTFAKAFLVTLDKKTIKLPADHVSDPRKYPNQSPYIISKQAHALPKKDPSQLATTQSNTITVTIKPMKGGNTIALSSISLDETVHDVKTRYAQQASLSVDKIKLLINKKPAADLKTLQELGIGDDVDMSAMVMGGAAVEAPVAGSPTSTPLPQTSAANDDKMEIDSAATQPGSEEAQIEAEAAASQDTTTQDMLKSAEFWSDLEGFLSQRLRDQNEASRLASLFKKSLSQS